MRANILSIAREMMQAEGVAALSFNAIARRLGMTPPALYTYFSSKHAIYDTLFRQGFEMFAAEMQQQAEQSATLEAQLRRGFESYFRFAQENPDLYQLMMQRPVPGFVPSEESMAVSLAALADVHERMTELIANGAIAPPLPVAEAVDLTISLMQGITTLHLANNPELPVGEGRFGKLADQAARLFIDAWRPTQEES